MEMSLMNPPRVFPLFRRRPVETFSPVKPMTVTFRTPPLISLPMQMPAEVGDVQVRFLMTIFSEAFARPGRYPKQSQPDLIATFEMFDADGGGSIDACETRALLQELGVEMSEEQVLEEVNLIDADGNGDIDLREFTQRWQSQDGVEGRSCHA